MSEIVSIIIPLYNYARYIGDCIQSALNQDYDKFEIIVVDDHSTDESYRIAKQFECSKVRILRHETNLGYSTAKNTGIKHSNGRYICIIDADDMLTVDSIATRVVAMGDSHLFVHANAIAIFDDFTLEQAMRLNISTLPIAGHTSRTPYLLKFPTKYEIHAQTVMVDRAIHVKFGLYDERLRSRSDREMWWRLFGQSERDPSRIERVYCDKPVAYYRYHNNSMMVMRRKNKLYDSQVRTLAEKLYRIRRAGITSENTQFLVK